MRLRHRHEHRCEQIQGRPCRRDKRQLFRLTRRHNDSNVLCLGGELLGKWSVLSIVETWLTTEYDGGHHQPSLDLIADLESVNMTGERWCPDSAPYPPFDWDPSQSL